MNAEPDTKRTNHARWLLGAVLLFIPIPVLMSFKQDSKSSPRETTGAVPAPVSVEGLVSEAGPQTCGQCNGDGRIDDQDRLRRVPATLASPGDCPYCGPGRTVGTGSSASP